MPAIAIETVDRAENVKSVARLQEEVRREADVLLRDLAQVLKWTARVKESIVSTAKLN